MKRYFGKCNLSMGFCLFVCFLFVFYYFILFVPLNLFYTFFSRINKIIRVHCF